jgi:hypothetical protein
VEKMQVFLHVAIWLIAQADFDKKNVDISWNSWPTIGTAMLEQLLRQGNQCPENGYFLKQKK